MWFNSRLRYAPAALAPFLVLAAVAYAAQPAKEWKENQTGNAGEGSKWKDEAETPPGKSDRILVTSGQVTFDQDVPQADSLEFTGGIISGALSLLSLTDTSLWSGGEINAATINTNGAVISAGDAKRIKNGATLNLAGSTVWSGGDLSTGGDAEITNTGTFATDFGGRITRGEGGNSAFKNNGSFIKNTAATVTEIEARFENKAIDSSVAVNGGTLRLRGGGESSKAVTVANGAKLEIADSDYTFSGGILNATGTGSIDVTSAIATFGNTSGNATLSVSGSGTARISGSHATTGRLKLSAGKLDATTNTDTATVGGFDWTGGDVTTAVVHSSDTTIGGADPKRLNGGARLNLANSTAWTAGPLSTGGGAEITNTGAFTISFDATIANDQGGNRATFRNQGSFTKTSDTNGITEIQANFASTGAVNVNGGTLKLNGGGNSSSAVTVGANAKLELNANNFDFTGGTLNSDATGGIEVTGAVTSFAGTTGSANLSVSGSGTARFAGSHATTGKFKLLNGTVDGAGNAEVGSLEWAGGNLNAKVTSNGLTSITGGSKSLNGGELTLAGSTTWDGSQINASGAAKIRNQSGQTFAASADGLITSTGNAVFTNEGIFEKTAGNGGATQIHARFESTGSLKATAGTLRLTGGGNSSNAVTVGANAKLELNANNFDFTGGTLNSDATGGIEVTGAVTSFAGTTGSANLSVSGSGTARFAGSHVTTGKFKLLNGTVDGAGTAEVGSLEWAGGNLNATVKSSGNASITGGFKSLNGGELTLAGSTTWDGTTISTGNGARLRNDPSGVFNATDGVIDHDGSNDRGTFSNAGQFNKSSGGGTTHIATHFENLGIVNVGNGKLRLAAGARNEASGKFEVGSGAELELDGDVELAAGSELKGNGRARILNGTLLANTVIELLNIDFDGGVLAGNNSFKGVVNWNGGDWGSNNAAFDTTIVAGSILNLRKGSGHEFNRRSILNQGTVNWTTGTLRAGNGSVFANSHVFNDLNGSANAILAPGGFGGTFTFTNNGTYAKSGAGTTTFHVTFVNNGGIEITAGNLVFAGAFTNNGRIHLLNGASAQFSSPLTFTASKPLSGTGVIDAPSVTAEGLVSPGVSPGSLSLTGDLTLVGTSELLIELAGPAQGTEYDFLGVGGTAAIDGTLSLVLLNGFGANIALTDTFTVLKADGGLNGAFSNVANGGRLFMVDGVGSFQINYGLTSAFAADSLVLSHFSPIPEPSTYAMLGIGALLIFLRLRKRR